MVQGGSSQFLGPGEGTQFSRLSCSFRYLLVTRQLRSSYLHLNLTCLLGKVFPIVWAGVGWRRVQSTTASHVQLVSKCFQGFSFGYDGCSFLFEQQFSNSIFSFSSHSLKARCALAASAIAWVAAAAVDAQLEDREVCDLDRYVYHH